MLLEALLFYFILDTKVELLKLSTEDLAFSLKEKYNALVDDVQKLDVMDAYDVNITELNTEQCLQWAKSRKKTEILQRQFHGGESLAEESYEC